MGNKSEVMNLEELARYLRRDLREISRLASRGRLPGRKVAGEWRFCRAEINQWVESQLPGYSEEELVNLEGDPAEEEPDYLVGGLLRKVCMEVPLKARTKGSVLRELVSIAERSWQVYKPDALVDALTQREETASTALDNGVALPHPHRPMPNAIGESLIAYGRTFSGIPFGEPNGSLTDIFFLVCCRDDRTHLRVLARISRLLLRPGFLDELRSADTPTDTLRLIDAAERELVAV